MRQVALVLNFLKTYDCTVGICVIGTRHGEIHWLAFTLTIFFHTLPFPLVNMQCLLPISLYRKSSKYSIGEKSTKYAIFSVLTSFLYGFRFYFLIAFPFRCAVCISVTVKYMCVCVCVRVCVVVFVRDVVRNVGEIA